MQDVRTDLCERLPDVVNQPRCRTHYRAWFDEVITAHHVRKCGRTHCMNVLFTHEPKECDSCRSKRRASEKARVQKRRAVNEQQSPDQPLQCIGCPAIIEHPEMRRGKVIQRCRKCRDLNIRQQAKVDVEVRRKRCATYELKESTKQIRKEYAQQHPEQARERVRRYHAAHKDDEAFKERNRATVQRWRQTYPERVMTLSENRRWRPSGATTEDCEALRQLSYQPCFYCNTAADPIHGIDRLDSSKGYCANNAVPACIMCNWMKNTVDPLTFLRKVWFIARPEERFVTYEECMPKSDGVRRLCKYKLRASQRSLEFTLTEEDFQLILTRPCSYCGIQTKVGLDRVDNDVGYVANNVVAACWDAIK